jgi:L-alanine-DL-glutamate epimerase-like enolase superfamily enzyme
VCTLGLSGLRRLARDVVAAGKTFSPHTWGNGIGLLANAHLAAGTVGTPFLEFPFDPPEWVPGRRDFVLTDTIEVDTEGWIVLGDRPGLGCTLDETALAATASHVATFS